MRNIALPMANEPRAKAARVVTLSLDRIPNPQNSRIDHDATTIRSGQEIGLASCNDMRSLVCLDLSFICADRPQELLLTVAGGAQGRKPRHHAAQAWKNGRSLELLRVGAPFAPDDFFNP